MATVIYDAIKLESSSPSPSPPSGPCPGIQPPTLAGFQAFIVNTMGISNAILDPNDPVICMAFTVAMDIVATEIATVSPDIYTLCVYNLGGSNIINFAQDQVGAPNYGSSNLPYFAYLRQKWNILGYVSGTIQSASDVSTSETMVVPDYAKNMNWYELQVNKDPFGRRYLAFAQMFGTLWGIS